MSKRYSHDYIRDDYDAVSHLSEKFKKFSAQGDAYLDYNGGCEEYEDPADYVKTAIRGGVRVG